MKNLLPKNSKGISVIFLVIAMLLMVTIGYVFSYLIPSKQKSVIFPIQSTQAFFIAQSGVEFAVQYAITQTPPWTTTAQLNGLDAMTRNLGAGRFVLDYDSAFDTLHSWGEVPTDTERRRISVSNFTRFLGAGLKLVTPNPCWITENQSVRFFIKNESPSDITIHDFSATWSQIKTARLREIYMGQSPPLTRRYRGSYGNGDTEVLLDSDQTVTPNQTIQVEIYWHLERINGAIVIIFSTTTGEHFTITVGTPSSTC